MEDLSGKALLFTQQSQQKMLRADMLVAEALRLLGSIRQYALALIAQREVHRGGNLLPNGSVSFNLFADGLNRSMRPQKAVGECFVFAQQAQQQMFGLYIWRAELAGLVARK